MTKRTVRIFDKIGALIPGYNGYAIRDEKRNDDKKLRNSIAFILEQSENEIIRHQQILENEIADEKNIDRSFFKSDFRRKYPIYFENHQFLEPMRIKELISNIK